MQASNVPTKMPVVWGSSAGAGFIRTVPVPSQIGINAGYASFTDGFVPLNFVNPNAGGVPPWGQDFNGLLNVSTAWHQWAQAGGPVNYDAAFSTSIGGYPQYALIASTSTPGAWWQSQVDNNTSDPDTGGANWILCTMQQPYLDARYLKVTSATTFYVNGTTGNDTFNGLSPTVGTGSTGPFKTLAGAVQAISKTYSFNVVTVNVAAGTYAGFSVGSSLIASWSFVGTGASTCFVTSVFNDAHLGTALYVYGGAVVTVAGFTWSGYVYGIVGQGGVTLTIGPNSFNNCTVGSCIFVENGTLAYLIPATYGGSASYAVTGTSNAFLTCSSGSQFQVGYTNPGKAAPNTLNVVIALTGATFSTGVVITSTGGEVTFSPANVTWSGTPTGHRFVLSNGTIATSGSGLNYIPGTLAGVISAGMTLSGGVSSTEAAGLYT